MPTLRIPAEFIADRACLKPQEIAMGYRLGWISARDVVRLVELKYEEGRPLAQAEEAVLLLLPDDVDQVGSLCDSLARSDEPTEMAARVWMYLGLAWLLVREAELTDPLSEVEKVWTALDDPAEMAGLIKWLPAEPDEPTGEEVLKARWVEIVGRLGEEYRDRSRC
jgi:hypothetical protein